MLSKALLAVAAIAGFSLLTTDLTTPVAAGARVKVQSAPTPTPKLRIKPRPKVGGRIKPKPTTGGRIRPSKPAPAPPAKDFLPPKGPIDKCPECFLL